MWSDRIVVVAPEGQLTPRIFQGVEYFLVQQLVPEAAVKAFDERILLRLARIDGKRRLNPTLLLMASAAM